MLNGFSRLALKPERMLKFWLFRLDEAVGKGDGEKDGDDNDQ